MKLLRTKDMVTSKCFQSHWATFVAFVFILTCYSEIVDAQQNWFKPAATTRRPLPATITGSKVKRFPEARKPATVVFPEGTFMQMFNLHVRYGVRVTGFLNLPIFLVTADGQNAESKVNKMHQEVNWFYIPSGTFLTMFLAFKWLSFKDPSKFVEPAERSNRLVRFPPVRWQRNSCARGWWHPIRIRMGCWRWVIQPDSYTIYNNFKVAKVLMNHCRPYEGS